MILPNEASGQSHADAANESSLQQSALHGFQLIDDHAAVSLSSDASLSLYVPTASTTDGRPFA